jgi:hypothetical protein
MQNQDIRKKAKELNVKLWEIAEVLRINDSNFSRKLRRELPSMEKQRIFSIIDDLAKGR